MATKPPTSYIFCCRRVFVHESTAPVEYSHPSSCWHWQNLKDVEIGWRNDQPLTASVSAVSFLAQIPSCRHHHVSFKNAATPFFAISDSRICVLNRHMSSTVVTHPLSQKNSSGIVSSPRMTELLDGSHPDGCFGSENSTQFSRRVPEKCVRYVFGTLQLYPC